MTVSLRALGMTAASLALAVGPLAGVGAHAAEREIAVPGRAAVVQALSDCRKIGEDAQRLACYDKAAGALDQAETKGDVVVVDRERAKEVRRQAFGFRMPTISIFSRGVTKADEGVDHLNLEVDSVHHSAEGKWVFVATDGAVWRQTDSEELSNDPHKGSKLLVKNGLLGSFFCKIDGQPMVRCERVR